ncbi:MAG TPA: hypothetical protein VMB52_04325 [Verrucomicrobiae bacterium]|nr:hypothetical protein [Verrucomicrobiae bacterium]
MEDIPERRNSRFGRSSLGEPFRDIFTPGGEQFIFVANAAIPTPGSESFVPYSNALAIWVALESRNLVVLAEKVAIDERGNPIAAIPIYTADGVSQVDVHRIYGDVIRRASEAGAPALLTDHLNLLAQGVAPEEIRIAEQSELRALVDDALQGAQEPPDSST